MKYTVLFFVFLFISISRISWAGLSNGLESFKVGHYSEAMQEFRSLAKYGNTTAQTHLGYMFRDGLGVLQDYSKAIFWFVKAGRHERPDAHYALSMLLLSGFGDMETLPDPIRLLRFAAEKGFLEAQYELGKRLVKGNAVEHNPKEGYRFLRKAARKGFNEAQLELGLLYLYGNGVSQNFDMAYKWFAKSSNGGNPEASLQLAIMYLDGKGVPLNEEIGFVWYRKFEQQRKSLMKIPQKYQYHNEPEIWARTGKPEQFLSKLADRGYSEAQNDLGVIYALKGADKNKLVHAHKWLNIATAAGDSKARQNLLKVSREMTAKQIEDAQNLASIWSPCIESVNKNKDSAMSVSKILEIIPNYLLGKAQLDARPGSKIRACP